MSGSDYLAGISRLCFCLRCAGSFLLFLNNRKHYSANSSRQDLCARLKLKAWTKPL